MNLHQIYHFLYLTVDFCFFFIKKITILDFFIHNPDRSGEHAGKRESQKNKNW